MLRGLAAISYWADDLEAAREGYTELLGIAPHFERRDADNPACIEFRLGDYQHVLRIIGAKYAPPAAAGPGGIIAYGHMDDVAATLQKRMAMGAEEYEPLTARVKRVGSLPQWSTRSGTFWASCTTRTTCRFLATTTRRDPHHRRTIGQEL